MARSGPVADSLLLGNKSGNAAIALTASPRSLALARIALRDRHCAAGTVCLNNSPEGFHTDAIFDPSGNLESANWHGLEFKFAKTQTVN